MENHLFENMMLMRFLLKKQLKEMVNSRKERFFQIQDGMKHFQNEKNFFYLQNKILNKDHKDSKFKE